MQKIKIALLILAPLLASAAWASELNAEVKSFSQKLKTIGGKERCETSEEAPQGRPATQDLELSLKCVQDICGMPEEGGVSLIPSNKKIGEIWSDPRLKNSVSLFEKALRAEESARITALKKASEFFSNPDFQYSKELIDAKTMDFARSIAGSLFAGSKEVVNTDGRVQVPLRDEKELRASWAEIGISEADAGVLLKAFREDKYAQASAMDGVGAAFIYDFLMPSVDFQEAVRQDIKDAKNTLQRLPKTAAIQGLGLNAENYKPIFSMADGDRYVDGQLGNAIFEKTNQLHFASRLLNDAKLRTVVERATASYLAKDRKDKISVVQSMAAEAPANFDELKDPKALFDLDTFSNSPNSELGTIFRKCFTNLSYGLATYPTKEQLKKAQPALEKTTDNVIKALSKSVSPETFRCLKGPLSKIRNSLPPSQDEYLASFNALFTDKLNDSKRILHQAATDSTGDFSVAYALRGDLNGSPHPFDLYGRCRDLAVRPVSDHTEFGFSIIALSAESVKNPDFGSDVAAHEIGHLVSSLMNSSKCISPESRKKYKKTKDCLEGMHLADSEDERSSRFEEDFADLISAKASINKKNMWCEMYANIDAKSPSLSVVANKNDPHSSRYMRLLHTQKVKTGNLPTSCHKSLPQSFNFAKCL